MEGGGGEEEQELKERKNVKQRGEDRRGIKKKSGGTVEWEKGGRGGGKRQGKGSAEPENVSNSQPRRVCGDVADPPLIFDLRCAHLRWMQSPRRSSRGHSQHFPRFGQISLITNIALLNQPSHVR
ncbi:hypothetical protein niasHT_005244 [Heterodera trifolii]|uniref:Uncharacterized protein n=1 Tax=Heterodera trifolii TaxID=157864 RepID=A0ABD2LSB7_9BILA